MLTGWIIDI